MWFKSRNNNKKINTSELYFEIDKIKSSILDKLDYLEADRNYSFDRDKELLEYKIETELEQLKEKLYSVKYTDNLVTEEWWNYLPEHWKRMVAFNLKHSYDEPNILTFYALRRYNPSVNDLRFENVKHNISKIKSFSFVSDNKDELFPLIPLTGIETLGIWDNYRELKTLIDLPNLTKLLLMRNTADIEILSEFDDVNSLTLSLNTKNLEPVSKMKQLKELSLEKNEACLMPLISMPHLESLELDNNVSSFLPLANMKSIRKIKICNRNDVVKELTPISELTDLTHLHLKNCYSNLSFIYDFKSLKVLRLDNCSIVKSDLKFQRLKSEIEARGGQVYD
jgi:hypothetical protein